MVHVAGGEEGSIRHDDEMPGPAPRVDLGQSTTLTVADPQHRLEVVTTIPVLPGVTSRRVGLPRTSWSTGKALSMTETSALA